MFRSDPEYYLTVTPCALGTIMRGHKSIRERNPELFYLSSRGPCESPLSIIVDPDISFGIIPPRYVLCFKFYNCQKVKSAHICVLYKLSP